MTEYIIFAILFVTHLVCLWIGWYAGIRVHNPHMLLPKTKKSDNPEPKIDIYDDERLDYT